jgi:hypothetical protein
MAEVSARFMSGLEDEEIGAPEGDEDAESTEEESGELDEEGGELDEEFAEEIEDEESDDFVDDTFEADEDLKVVDEALSHKDQNARALAIRRAIEERLEAKRLSKDLDYLDLDLDSDD